MRCAGLSAECPAHGGHSAKGSPPLPPSLPHEAFQMVGDGDLFLLVPCVVGAGWEEVPASLPRLTFP